MTTMITGSGESKCSTSNDTVVPFSPRILLTASRRLMFSALSPSISQDHISRANTRAFRGSVRQGGQYGDPSVSEAHLGSNALEVALEVLIRDLELTGVQVGRVGVIQGFQHASDCPVANRLSVQGVSLDVFGFE